MRKNQLSRRLFTFGLIALFAGFAFFAVEPAQAITIVPRCARINATDPPSLRCALLTFTNVASLIVGVTGSFALLMFVYGGFTLLTSGGSDEKVKKGKDILRNAIIGMFLIFTAGYIIDYAVKSLQGRHEVTLGSSCNDLGGTYQSIPGRGAVCRTQCTARALADQGYRCLDPRPAEPGGPERGTNCNIDYVCGTDEDNSQCCISTTVCINSENQAGASCVDVADCPAGNRCDVPPPPEAAPDLIGGPSTP